MARCKTNCFAYKDGHCTVLTELICASRACSFYKSVAQYNADKIKYPYIDYKSYKQSKCNNKVIEIGECLMKAITVKELIEALKEIKNPNALVGISSDSEGNSFSLIANEQFLAQGFMTPELGYNEYHETQEIGTMPAVVLFGTN